LAGCTTFTVLLHNKFLRPTGASDHVFILCAMLGIRSCPRLRDLPDRKLACIKPLTTADTTSRRARMLILPAIGDTDLIRRRHPSHRRGFVQ
jgi:TnpA family transposase